MAFFQLRSPFNKYRISNVEEDSNTRNISVSDSVTVSENVVITVSDPQINVSDTITLTENISLSVVSGDVYFISVSDTIAVTENQQIELNSFINKSDSITVTESTAFVVPINLTTSDSITVTESIILTNVLNIRTTGSTTVTIDLSTAANDAGESNDTTIITGGNTIKIGNDTGTRYDGGFIFPSVNVPAGARILSASFRLDWDTVTVSDPTLNTLVKGELSGGSNPAAWSSTARPSQRTKTNTSVTYNWDTNGFYNPTITDVVQEIVNQKNWASGNSMAIIVEENGQAAGNWTTFIAAEQAAGQVEPRLVITYTEILTDIIGVSESITIELNSSINKSESITVTDSLYALQVDKKYTREEVNALPATDANLATQFTQQEYTDVATSDNTRVTQ